MVGPSGRRGGRTKNRDKSRRAQQAPWLSALLLAGLESGAPREPWQVAHRQPSPAEGNLHVGRVMRRTRRRTIKVRLHAYLRGNLGDDLFVALLCRRYAQVTFYADCDRTSAAALKEVANFRTIPRIPRVDGVLKALGIGFRVNPRVEGSINRRCVAVVYIGGSIFMQKENWQEQIVRLRNRLVAGIPAFVIGANFGPYRDPDYLVEIQFVLRDLVDVCFRDRYSAELFAELDNVRCAPDVVFSLQPPALLETQECAVISVINLAGRGGLNSHKTIYERKILEIAQACVDRGLDVIFMGFCEREGDCNVARAMAHELNSRVERNHVSSYCYQGDLGEALGVLARSRIVVASRFHAMVLAWRLGKPVYPIVYSEKMTTVMDDMDYAGPWVRIEELEGVDAEEAVSRLLVVDPFDVGLEVDSAQLQFEALDGFLSGVIDLDTR